jgi:hypothetical protein
MRRSTAMQMALRDQFYKTLFWPKFLYKYSNSYLGQIYVHPQNYKLILSEYYGE